MCWDIQGQELAFHQYLYVSGWEVSLVPECAGLFSVSEFQMVMLYCATWFTGGIAVLIGALPHASFLKNSGLLRWILWWYLEWMKFSKWSLTYCLYSYMLSVLGFLKMKKFLQERKFKFSWKQNHAHWKPQRRQKYPQMCLSTRLQRGRVSETKTHCGSAREASQKEIVKFYTFLWTDR